ncbi:penicillin-binding protein activator LpoB [Motiliproteus sp. SC1-56]|uniref:penicillin-binding protein activator LpoB n=1 Tax=Motiliproteus sp. SC1-56 TaxID=2799565 RepID=UPI001A8D3A13|nr:penicillin-binding protein activator LpoB [Motiliproteus sp. SC1-56]
MRGALACICLLLVACGTQVTRIAPQEQVDLSGAWNDTDSRLVAEAMIEDALSHPWITDFHRDEGHRPAVILGSIRNLSHEHINVQAFLADIERALVNSGQVTFVANPQERRQVRDERLDQDLHAQEATRNPAGQELGADFLLNGQINTIIDANDRQQVRYYQVDLSMISLADNRKVWLGQKKIKKRVDNARIRY